ncbi:MAG: serine acetyltransferase [Solirubrobacterales bacterium]
MVSPERLWLLSISLQQRGHRRLATLVRNVNSALHHNSLPPGASVSPDIELGHHGLGIVVHPNVVIGRRVKIWHNVTIATRAGSKSPYRIVIEDDVKIGANAVVISPHRGDLRIGRGARIGAGAVVSRDVPAGSTVVNAPVQVLGPGEPGAERDLEAAPGSSSPEAQEAANGSGAGQAGVAARAPLPPRKAEPLA